MTIFNVISVLGALAWLPFIIQLIREKIKRPKLKIISDDQIEIGYTYYGPIINISMAFLSETKGALINKIKLTVRHQSNENQIFEWNWFEESLLQMDLPKLPINYKKNQKAIALNVPENVLVEKKIGFQNTNFKSEAGLLLKKIREDSINLKFSGKELSELKSYSSYNDAIDYIQNSFNWKNGLYEAKFTIYIAGTDEVFEHEIKFQLNNLDIKLIHKNIDICKSYFENLFINIDNEFTESFSWVYTNKLSDLELLKLNQSK